jgi:MFS family permease
MEPVPEARPRARVGLLLQNRSYRLLWAGQTISSFGDRFISIALPFGVLEAGHGVGALGIVLAARAIPSVGFLLVSGVVADRLPRRLVMLASDGVRAIAHLVLAALIASHGASVAAFAGLEALYGAADAFFNPATVGLIPEMVPKESLQQANAFLSLSRNTISVTSPAIAGFLVLTAGPAWAFAIDGLSFIASGVCLAMLRVPPRIGSEEHASFRTDLVEGWRYVASVRWLWFTIATFAMNNVFFTPLFVLGPIIALRSLGGAGVWGLIGAAGSVGALAGSLAAVRWQVPRPLLMSYVLTPLMGLPLLFLSVPSSPWLIGLGIGLAWAATSFGNTLWFTVLQHHVPSDKLSRTSAVDDFGSFVLNPIAFALVGPISGAFGFSTTLLVCGLALIILPMVQLALVPEIRKR